MAWFQSLSATSWAMVRIPISCAPHRTGRRRSIARPRFRITQRAGAYPLMERLRESRARSQVNGPGRGWTLQVSGLETLEKARQHIQYHPGQSTLKRCKGEQSGRMGQSAYCQAARSEWPFRFRLKSRPASVRGAGRPPGKECPSEACPAPSWVRGTLPSPTLR